MSNYTIVTNFLSKDALISGNPLKLVKGADLTTEFTAVQTALNTKIDGVVQFFTDGSASQPSVGFTNNAGTGMFNTAGVLSFATNATLAMSISAAGAVSIAAPSAGASLTVAGGPGNSFTVGQAATFNGVASATTRAVVINAPTTAGQSHGLQVNAGTNSSDICFEFSQADTVSGNNIMFAFGDGSVIVGNTGTAEGAGTLNVQNGLFIGNAPLYIGAPVTNFSTSNPTITLASANKCLQSTANSLTVTIPSNASVPFPVGTMLTFSNQGPSANTLSIAITSDTLVLAGTSTGGTRSLADNGLATALKVTSTLWIISGSGLT